MNTMMTIGVECPYHRRFRMPKWNGPVNVLREHRIMRRLPEFSGWTHDQHVQAALDAFTIARNFARMYRVTLDHAVRTFGDRHTPIKPAGVTSQCEVCTRHGLTHTEHESLNHQTGAMISGIYADHFPDRVKFSLRSYARLETEYLDRSIAHWRAAGRRIATWRAYRDANYYGR